jgi:hypothetical protein
MDIYDSIAKVMNIARDGIVNLFLAGSCNDRKTA